VRDDGGMAPLSMLSYVELRALLDLVGEYGAAHDDGRAPAWRDMAFAELRRRFDAIDENLRINAEAKAAREHSGH
jgi:hypothetical protein